MIRTKQIHSLAVLVLGLSASAMAGASSYFLVTPMGSAEHSAPGGSPSTPELPPVTPPVEPEPAAPEVRISLANTTAKQLIWSDPQTYDLNAMLSILEDDPDIQGSAQWSMPNLVEGLTLNGSTLTMAIDSKKTASVLVDVNYKGKTAQATLQINAGFADSCRERKNLIPNDYSGWFTLEVNGVEGSYYCDQTSAGGGWTRVVRQYESAPLLWTGGGSAASSYVIASSAIPAHTQTGFGQDNQATAMDYFQYQYTTGNIPVTSLVGLKGGVGYQIHRDSNLFYGSHDPENAIIGMQDQEWMNTLTVDAVGGSKYSWAFSPRYSQVGARGYALNGARHSVADSISWTVWVR